MTSHRLRLFRDRLAAKAVAAPLAVANRVFYVTDGMATLTTAAAVAAVAPNSAFYSGQTAEIAAGADGARLLRYELVGAGNGGDGIAVGDGVTSNLLLEAELELDSPDGYLMRCDRVDIPPGGTAYTHTHRGPGIRCLLEGGFNVEVHGEIKSINPGEAWFEAGPDAVLAWAGEDAPGNFSRVMILPRALKGKSSLSYVNPEDADKPKPQKYTIFIDRFIDI
jgi:quercetin dioxygenase-like cupin family protein